MIQLITRQINQLQVSRINQNNSTSRSNNLKQLNKDVFTPSFRGGEKFQLPLEKIEELGKQYILKFAQKTDGIEKYKIVNEFALKVKRSILKEQNAFIKRKKLASEDFNKGAFKKFIADCRHESTGSYLSLPQSKLIVPDKTLSFEVQQLSAQENFKDIVNHVNETTKRYQFFLNNNMDSETSTIGADKVFDLLIDAFKKQADDKNIKLVIHGKDILKKNAQSTHSDYKNYIIMSNLLGNAIKYSDENTVIELGFKTFKKDNHLHFFIKDQGIGVLKEDKKKIFDHKRGQNVGSRAGSGYGLYRTNWLMQDAGRKIKLKSPLYPNEPVHKGSMFEGPIFSDINRKFPSTKTE